MMEVKKDVVHFQQPDIMDFKILNPTKIDVKVTETVQINRNKKITITKVRGGPNSTNW